MWCVVHFLRCRNILVSMSACSVALSGRLDHSVQAFRVVLPRLGRHRAGRGTAGGPRQGEHRHT
eukprot:14771375-Alexandrium_andersonii.AAC.1